jgi:plastocyanin
MRRTAALFLIVLAACGGNAGSSPTRSYGIGLRVDDSADRYRYIATEAVDIRVGDEVTFELENTGTLIHDLQILDPEGTVIAKSEPIAAGGSLTLTARFDEAGFFRLNCLVDDHLTAHEMQTFVEVTDPDA